MSSETALRNGFETVRTLFEHKQLVWGVSRDIPKKGSDCYDCYGLARGAAWNQTCRKFRERLHDK